MSKQILSGAAKLLYINRGYYLTFPAGYIDTVIEVARHEVAEAKSLVRGFVFNGLIVAVHEGESAEEIKTRWRKLDDEWNRTHTV